MRSKKEKKLEREIFDLRYIIAQILPEKKVLVKTVTGRYVLEQSDFGDVPTEEVYEDPEVVNKRAEILRTAEDLINGDRARTYGAPEVSFGRIADIWNAQGYRHHVQVPDQPIGITKANKLDAVDAALILIGMKLSRTGGNRQHMDNWVDMAGYSGLGGELATPIDMDNMEAGYHNGER